MRVFHFVSEHYGLEDLRLQRLKIATLNELNDPFELFGVALHDERLRSAFQAMKAEISSKYGLLCFSHDWHNPVQWGHYADKHAGLCLGFDVPDPTPGKPGIFANVEYSRRRLVTTVEYFRDLDKVDIDLFRRFLFTKYSHWRYEKEVRAFLNLNDRDPGTGLYFADFSSELRLAQVIVGARSTATRARIQAALGTLAPTVEAFKARLAFKTFRVVRQRNERLWA